MSVICKAISGKSSRFCIMGKAFRKKRPPAPENLRRCRQGSFEKRAERWHRRLKISSRGCCQRKGRFPSKIAAGAAAKGKGGFLATRRLVNKGTAKETFEASGLAIDRHRGGPPR